MSHSVSYNFNPGDNVYVINTLGPNGQYPYWGFPFVGAGFANFYSPGPVGYPGSYPNGFSSTTPAIMPGQVLQSRILMSTQQPSPIIMYDVRITGQLGTVSFPESMTLASGEVLDMVYLNTPGTSGTQEVNYNGTLTNSTVISKASSSYTATVYINGAPAVVTIDLSTTTSVASFIAAFNSNTNISGKAILTLSGGNLVVTSDTIGVSSSIVIVDTNLFSSIPGYVSIIAPVPGVASGLDQATAALEKIING